MKTNDPTPSSPENEKLHRRLSGIRTALLHLHKTLVDSERISYEQTVGKIPSASHFLQLLTDDPWFAWLHPFSQLIVAMDTVLDAKEPLTGADVVAMVKQTRKVLLVSESGQDDQEPSGHYYNALQRDPDVVLAHAEVVKAMK